MRETLPQDTWLAQLPERIRTLERRWSLRLGPPMVCGDGTCSSVTPATLMDGTGAILKIGMPHMEAEHEIDGLRFWNGDPTVRLLDADRDLDAMLLERCEPGTSLKLEPEPDQDVIVARLLRRLWRRPGLPHPFRPLSAMLDHWSEETAAQSAWWSDTGLVREGLQLFDRLARGSSEDVLLATDLHAGNVLRAAREPWLVIDPKPFIGDPAYDATQHLLNCGQRLRADPHGIVRRIADLLEIDAERVRLWLFARTAAEPRERWEADWLIDIARAIAP